MEKRKSLLIGILIVIVVAIALVLIDSTLPLHSEVQSNKNNERLNYFERKKSSAKRRRKMSICCCSQRI